MTSIRQATLNHRQNYQRNKVTILSLVRRNPGISRVDIAKRLNLSTATITLIMETLTQQGLIVEQGVAEDTLRGRKPIRLTIASRTHFFLTIDIGAENIRVAVMDLAAEVLTLEKCKTHGLATPEKQLEAVQTLAKRAVQQAGLKWTDIEAVSCGISGFVDPVEGMVHACPNIPGWQNTPLRDHLERMFKKPCFIEDSTPLKTLAESYEGKGRASDNFVYLNLGVGISLGIVINGSLYRGVSGGAGEIGHIPILGNGRPCKCGNIGCLETVASGPRIVETLREALRNGAKSSLQEIERQQPGGATLQDLANAVQQQDRLALKIVREVGEQIGRVAASVGMCLNPEMFILGGPVAKLGDVFTETIKSVIQQQTFPHIGRHLHVDVSNLDDDKATLIGGLILIAENHWNPVSERKSATA